MSHDQYNYQRSHQQDLQRKGQEALHNFKNFLMQNSPSTPKTIALLTILPFAAFLLFLAGLSFMGSLIGLALATPVFLLFSPVIVPAVLVIGFAVVGFGLSGAFGITALSALSWIINFLRYQAGSMDQIVDWARETAGYVGQQVKEMGQDVGGRARETAGYVGQQVKEMGQDVGGRARETAGYVGQQVKEMGQDVGGRAREVSRT